MKELKVLELFSGYGGATYGLTKANIPHKVIGYSDIEKCANYIYELNHGKEVLQLNDITKVNVNDLEDFDLLTGGFPCQSFSLAGKREGFKAERKGQLFFEIIRIAEKKRPRYMLLENVQGLLSHDNGKTMQVILQELKEIGYIIKWKLMFSKDLGTPQNRPRVWFACFRDKVDSDKFMFPEKEKLSITVKDLLDDEVDDKYYLNENQLKKIEEGLKKENYSFYSPPEDLNKPIKTLKAHMGNDNSDVPYFQVADYRYDEGLRIRKDEVCPTLKARNREKDLSGSPIIYNTHSNYWRRLTPTECFRLQGFFKDEINFGNLSDSKLYFLAGNGWDINVASKIFIQMFKGNQNKQKSLFNY